jgi:hypothetical protein
VFKRWADAVSNPKAKAALLLIAVVGTVALVPLSLFGPYVLVMSVFSDAPDRYMFLGWSMVGTGGLLAIAAGWVRLLIPRRYFQEHPALKWTTVFSLMIGLFIAVSLLFNPGMAWLVAATIPVGIFLLGATLGERKPINTEGSESVRSAP